MLFNIILYDGSEIEVDGAPDNAGITYENQSRVVIPGEEDVMHMVLIPWAAISRVEYDITPDMIAPDVEVDPREMNRAARRAK